MERIILIIVLTNVAEKIKIWRYISTDVPFLGLSLTQGTIIYYGKLVENIEYLPTLMWR